MKGNQGLDEHITYTNQRFTIKRCFYL